MERGTGSALTISDELRRDAREGDARAQYALSELEFKRGNKSDALVWLTKSVQSDYPDACYTIATFQVSGVSVPYDAIGARLNLTKAANQGHKDAQLLLSQMARSGYGGDKNDKVANDLLLGLAKEGHPVALCVVAMLLYVRNQKNSAVEVLLERAALGGSHIAAYIQAERRRDAALSGDAVAFEERIKYLFVSAQAGNGLAVAEIIGHDKSIVQEILGRTSFTPTMNSNVNFEDIEQVLGEHVAYSFDEPESLSSEKNILVYRNFMTPLECSYIKAAAAPTIQPSSTIHPQTGELIKHEVRTSSSSNFDPLSRDCFVFSVDERIAEATGTNVEQGEPLNVLYYRIGEEYRFHYDHLPEGDSDETAIAQEGGQREYTFLVALNDDYSGGETVFPKLNLSYRGNLGDGLMFHNLKNNGRPNNMMLHAGLPVSRGCKWVASKWIREGEFNFGRPQSAPT